MDIDLLHFMQFKQVQSDISMLDQDIVQLEVNNLTVEGLLVACCLLLVLLSDLIIYAAL